MFTFQFRNERITNVCLFHDFVYSLKSSIYADGLFNQFFGRGRKRRETGGNGGVIRRNPISARVI